MISSKNDMAGEWQGWAYHPGFLVLNPVCESRFSICSDYSRLLDQLCEFYIYPDGFFFL